MRKRMRLDLGGEFGKITREQVDDLFDSFHKYGVRDVLIIFNTRSYDIYAEGYVLPESLQNFPMEEVK